MIKDFSYKQFGNLYFQQESPKEDMLAKIEHHIKILFLPKDCKVQVDFQLFQIETDSLLFINPNVVIKPIGNENTGEILLHFNRDFYCIEIHDHEVACDGILYNNVFEVPFVQLNENQSANIQNIIREIQSEMEFEDANSEEMLRILLKNIILKSTRIWKQQHQLSEQEQQPEVQFLRKFSKLVEQHYKTHHSVADYAEMLFFIFYNWL